MSKTIEQTGLDRSLPHIGVIMEKTDTDAYPRVDLAEGYRFAPFRTGFERQWARLQCEVGQLDSQGEAEEVFINEFLRGKGTDWTKRTDRAQAVVPAHTPLTAYPCYEQMQRRVLFVADASGCVVGTGALWPGRHFGEARQRLHYVAVHPAHQGQGIAKAIVSQLLDLYNELELAGNVYLTSQTWSYRAINIYAMFGFRPYLGEKPSGWKAVDLLSDPPKPFDYVEKNAEAWHIIGEKIRAYEERKGK